MVRLAQISFLICFLSYLNPVVNGMTDEYASSSVLYSGKWFKIAVKVDGIYRIDFASLKKLGLENPSNPRIFGNNVGQLSYFNDRSHPDDLKEIAIYAETGSDGIFNEGDYLLFYGKATNRWIFDNPNQNFRFLRHNYSDTAFYFITSGLIQGKKIKDAIGSDLIPGYNSSVSDALYVHEMETENIIHSGREWYQPVSFSKDTEINPGFKDLIITEKVKYQTRVLARSSSSTLFSLTENGSLLRNITVNGINLSSTTGTYAQAIQAEGEFTASSPSPVFKISFSNNGEISAKGWIDYVKFHARKLNRFEGQTTHYTDSRSVGRGVVTEFTIKSSSDEIILWDVSDPFTVKRVDFNRTGENLSFKLATDTLRTFVAFTIKNTLVPEIRNMAVPNQDLHASSAADMVIVTHPLFRSYAVELAGIHMEDSNLSSLIVTPEEIYNEFSGGIPDIAAIRNFIRMKFLDQKDTNQPLRYLLLFGDGSFDNKTYPPGNTNYVPTYQTLNSNIFISSFTSDDFYGLLEDGEGEETGTEDIGIGRIPASDKDEALIALSKIKGYLNPENRGNWKNLVSIIADDEDGNTHLSDAEGLAFLIKETDPWVNIDKIYFDAYNQVTSSTGQFYPDVSQAINDRINSGTLIFNYIGHGNENSLGHERVVTSESVEQWKNATKLPLFITATCEFSRFDDIIVNNVTGEMAAKKSTGEKILLGQQDGAIALMSTTRLVYSAPNYALNRNIIDVAFNRDQDGKALRLGDIMRIAKNRSGSNTNKRNFLLLGDPAVRLSWPWHGRVVTDSVNSTASGLASDTLKALSLINVAGHVEDQTGNLDNSFNGTVVQLVYGKPLQVQTLANDGGQKVFFEMQNNILFSGKTNAVNGRFRFAFIVPRDIDYSFGPGRISYYAFDENQEHNGSFSDIVVGGFSEVNSSDISGPEIRLFMNDTLFRTGGMTDENPRLLALIEDEGGINTAGTGIGHDIICWLDDNRSNPMVLNNYYENDFGSYNKGRIAYSFSVLQPGRHTLTLKAWDNFNNSTEESIIFLVDNGERFVLKNLFNFPNPFNNVTKISAEHNRPDELFEITITISNINGGIIRIIKTSSTATGYQLAPVEWDGRSSNGSRAGRGIYLYRIAVMTEKGETATGSGRMIIY